MGYFTKEQYDNYVNNYKLDCKTNKDVKSCKQDTSNDIFIYDTEPQLSRFCFPMSQKIREKLNILGDMSKLGTDLKRCRWVILFSVIFAFLIG